MEQMPASQITPVPVTKSSPKGVMIIAIFLVILLIGSVTAMFLINSDKQKQIDYLNSQIISLQQSSSLSSPSSSSNSSTSSTVLTTPSSSSSYSNSKNFHTSTNGKYSDTYISFNFPSGWETNIESGIFTDQNGKIYEGVKSISLIKNGGYSINIEGVWGGRGGNFLTYDPKTPLKLTTLDDAMNNGFYILEKPPTLTNYKYKRGTKEYTLTVLTNKNSGITRYTGNGMTNQDILDPLSLVGFTDNGIFTSEMSNLFTQSLLSEDRIIGGVGEFEALSKEEAIKPYITISFNISLIADEKEVMKALTQFLSSVKRLK